MKNLLRITKGHLALFIVVAIVFSLSDPQVVAQNVADSDLSNSAGTNKNWYGQGWFYALIIALIIIAIGVFGRRKSTHNVVNKERRNRL